MKQMIQCSICARRPLPEYPDEWVHRERGFALADYICDFCGRPIQIGTRCAAWSCGNEIQKYYPWEHKYIDVIGGPEYAA